MENKHKAGWVAGISAVMIAAPVAVGAAPQLPTQEQPAPATQQATPGTQTGGAASTSGAMQGTQQQNQNAQGQNMTGMTGMSGQTGTRQAAPVDAFFLRMAAESNLAEIALGRLVLERSRDADVRAVAQHIVTEHSKAQQQVEKLAQSQGAPLPSGPNPMQQAFYTHLSKKQGREFDKLYIAQQIQGHVKDVNLFYQHPMIGNSVEVRQFAKATLPKLAGHTEHLRQVARKIGVPDEFGRPRSAQLARQGGVNPNQRLTAAPRPGTSTAGSSALPTGSGMKGGGTQQPQNHGGMHGSGMNP